jgi:cytochrome P450
MMIKFQKRLKRIVSRLTRLPGKILTPQRDHLVFFFGGAEVIQPRVLDPLWRLTPFSETFEQCSAWVEQRAGWSPLRFLRDGQTFPEVSRFEKFVMPAMLTQLSLYEIYCASGVKPKAVIGLSLGESVAAYAAEAVSLQDVIELILVELAKIVISKPGRSFEVQSLTPDLEKALRAIPAYLILDMDNVKIWGVESENEEAALAWFNKNQIQFRGLSEFLPHTPIFPQQSVTTSISRLQARMPRIPLYLGTLGGRMTTVPNADYWWKMMTHTSMFGWTIRSVLKDGYRTILNVSIGSGYQDPLHSNISKINQSARILPAFNVKSGSTLIPDETRKALANIGIKLSANAFQRFEIPELDIQSPQFLDDPFACYRRWRQIAPVHYLPKQNGWLVLNYDDITSILKDPEHYSSAPYREFNTLLSGNDPPDHGRIRQILTPYFTRTRMLAYSERIEWHTRRFIDSVRHKPSFDFMHDFAQPLPLAITCDFLGIRYEGINEFRTQLAESPSWELLQSGLTGGGLISEIIANGQLNQLETVSICEFLIGAGVITVKDLLGNSVYTLLKNPDWMTGARAHPEAIPALLEELFRLEPPVLTLLRQTRTTVKLGGVTIPGDSLLYLAIGAANRDPAKYQSPDALILNRTGPKNLAFSVGPHYCMGVHMGRLQCEIILKLLLTESPALHAAQSLDRVEFIGSPHVREIRTLQLGFDRL